ncbi:Uncharacterized protein K3495_g6623 [Podosphaera aphanis]|nr:Uncharacterized protein K3495_g6623 [Podosphaera aphanis]
MDTNITLSQSSTKSRDMIRSYSERASQNRLEDNLERQPLIPKFKKSNLFCHNRIQGQKNSTTKRSQLGWTDELLDAERQQIKSQDFWEKISVKLHLSQLLSSSQSWDYKITWTNVILTSASILPAVFLGILLNILDALSYGLILFPRGLPPFAKLGSAGISMFYISCIVSQLVFSCGGSKFKGGIGSEMIEVIPFFHTIAAKILEEVGDQNPSAVVATTIVAYASSSILTGATFFLIGYFRVGYIIGFIPRHILIGCIGGVGWFLLTTGVEVTAGLDKFEYNLTTLYKLLHQNSLPHWLVSISLAIIYICTEKRFNFKFYLPTFVLLIPVIFYMIVFSSGKLDMRNLRSMGWILDTPLSGESWWHFYTLYSFRLVQWTSILKCIPSMFALTFFGILHVPINVPSLASSVGEDHLDLDREILAHGISNTLSGLCGSIQNYLVYTNSFMVIKSGGNSRLAGILIALATVIVMIIGPSIIGYIPVVMIGVLIFILGIFLLREAIWIPRKKLKLLEYVTVLAMVVTMGIYDFIIGILAGIGLAFISLTIQTSRISAVRAIYSGEVVSSTVRRSSAEQRFLKTARKQVCTIKLTGYLFFGTIVSVEEQIRGMIKSENTLQRSIHFLVLDFQHVTGIDHSASEAFCRIHRIIAKKDIKFITCGLKEDNRLRSTLNKSWKTDIEMFDDLNHALESCENELLKVFYTKKETHISTDRNLFIARKLWPYTYKINGQYSSSQINLLNTLAATVIHENPSKMKDSYLNEPMRLISHIFSTLTEKNEDFWARIIPFFSRKFFLAGTIIFRSGDQAENFFLLQEGTMKADYNLPQGHFNEIINAGTTCGELPFFSETPRTATVVAKQDCITWTMNRQRWNDLQISEPEIAAELLRIGLKMTSERMNTITSYIMTIAS